MAGEELVGPAPDGWKYTTLGIACQLGGGDIQTGPFGSQLHAADYVPVGIPSIMPLNIGDNRIVEEAARWLEKIERTISREEAQALRAWLKGPGHRDTIIDRCKRWHGPEILAVLGELIPVEKLADRVEKHYGRMVLGIFLGRLATTREGASAWTSTKAALVGMFHAASVQFIAGVLMILVWLAWAIFG